MKYTITSIGVIDRGKSLQRDFTITALDYMIDKERVLNYELYKDEQHEILDHIHHKINQYITEIQFLKMCQ